MKKAIAICSLAAVACGGLLGPDDGTSPAPAASNPIAPPPPPLPPPPPPAKATLDAKCGAGPATVLVDVPGLEPQTDLAVLGDTLYFLGRADDGSALGKWHMYRVPTSGGAPPEIVPIERSPAPVYEPIGSYRGSLVFLHGEMTATGNIDTVGIETFDPSTGVATPLQNLPAVPLSQGARADELGIYWESIDPGRGLAIWRHADGDTQLCTPMNPGQSAHDGTDLFVVDEYGFREWRFIACPLDGGAGRILGTRTGDDSRAYGLVSVDDSHVYYAWNSIGTDGIIGEGEIRAMAKDGSGDRLLMPHFPSSMSVETDATHIYWAAAGDTGTVGRVRKSDGLVETLMTFTGSYANRVVLDDRNVYLSVENPPAIVACSK